MKDIIIQANREAYKSHKEIIKLNLASENIKSIGMQKAREAFPRATRQERGKFAHQFFRKIRQYEQRDLYEEWSSDFTGGI